MSYSVGIIIIMSVLVIIAITLLMSESNHLVSWWNRHIKAECEAQDSISLNGIPSYHNAWESSDKTIIELHRLINVYHNEILSEVNDLFAKSLEVEEPFWIRFMGEWAGFSDQLPVLKQIAMSFPEVINLHVDTFYPGVTLIERREPNHIVYKYHYGLKVPRNDVGLKIAGFDVKWEEREGFVWDNTLPHSIWNHTAELRIVIFADVLRDFSLINSLGSKLIYSIMQRNPEVIEKKAKLCQGTIMIK